MRTALVGTVIVSVAALVGTGLGGLFFGGLSEFQQKIMWSAAVGALLGSIGLLTTVRLAQWRLPQLVPVGLALLCTAALLALAAVWGPLEPGGVPWKLVATAAVITMTVSHLAFLATFDSRKTWLWACRSIVMLIAIGVGFLMAGALWGGGTGGSGNAYYAWLTAALIFDALGTLGVVFLSRRFESLHSMVYGRQSSPGPAPYRRPAREPGPSF